MSALAMMGGMRSVKSGASQNSRFVFFLSRFTMCPFRTKAFQPIRVGNVNRPFVANFLGAGSVRYFVTKTPAQKEREKLQKEREKAKILAANQREKEKKQREKEKEKVERLKQKQREKKEKEREKALETKVYQILDF
jgi:hypothetical protein